MAITDSSGNAASANEIRLERIWWGEYYYGTRQALQSIGIGPGQTYPTTDSPRDKLELTDPRGFPCTLWRCAGKDETFKALIRFPERQKPVILMDFAPGVTKEEQETFDRYVGTGESLAAAGVVELSKLPGAPGMPKTRVNLGARDLPRGSTYKSVVIGKRGKLRFEVLCYVSDETRSARCEDTRAWERKWHGAPRPRSLTWRLEEAAKQALIDQAEVRSIQGLPSTKEAYRSQVADAFKNNINSIVNVMRLEHGYRYAEEDIAEFEQVANDLYWTLKQADIVGDSPSKALEKLMAGRAKRNQQLQIFLQQVGATS